MALSEDKQRLNPTARKSCSTRTTEGGCGRDSEGYQLQAPDILLAMFMFFFNNFPFIYTKLKTCINISVHNVKAVN